MNKKIIRAIVLIEYILCIRISNSTETKSEILRKNCLSNNTQFLTRINTTDKLIALRKIMNTEALLITSDDEHQTEFVSDYDKRLQYISGFTGSSGSAIVTMNKAALWTDSRYHLQADEELDCNWLLMKAGNNGVPSKEEWLKIQFPQGATIGADPKLISAEVWNNMKEKLTKPNKNFILMETDFNLIDTIWHDHNGTDILKEGFTINERFSGKNWTEKVNETRQKLKKLGADAMVVTALDEIAWLLNIRGFDIPYSYLLKSYVILSLNETVLYANPAKVTGNISIFFETYVNITNYSLRFRDYEDIWIDLPKYLKFWNKVLIPSTYVYSPGASKKIYDLIPDHKRIFRPSPVIDLKAKKNPVEILGMKKAHIRDSTALCLFLHHFESHFNKNDWDELRVKEIVDKFRSMENLFMNVSFPTIVAFGPNGALPHYQPHFKTSAKIFNNNTLVLDSGGQYYDGTTDVTRTLHMGTPTFEHVQAYTRVLIGSIQLSSLIFPDSANTANIDAFTRSSLWETGYDFPHGTGHGIGASLIVHESPISVSYKTQKPQRLRPGYFLSNEPGFYQENEFGVRLENIMEVIEISHLKSEGGPSFLGFEDVTLVPYDMKLVNLTLLNRNHVKWLNQYNTRIKNLIGPELQRRNASDTFDWILEKTKYISEGTAGS